MHFSNLLSLRNGSQAESYSLSGAVLEEDWNFDDDEEEDKRSVNTNLADRISDSGHTRLKQKFLDCLAGFAANEKGGAAVAYAAMKEGEDHIVIWISRNRGFSDVDKSTFEKFGKVLGSLGCNKGMSRRLVLFLYSSSFVLSRKRI
jgi:hypothetical protein